MNKTPALTERLRTVLAHVKSMGPAPAVWFARGAAVKTSQAYAALQQLEEKGLVKRNSKDASDVLWSITDAGIAALQPPAQQSMF